MDGVIQGFVDPYDRHENSGGVILLAVAENKLCWDILEPRIRQGFALVPRWAMSYGPMHGQSMLREPLAAFMGKHIYKGAVIVDPEHLVVGVGLSAILSSLFYCICEAGDSVLIPAPYYSAFDNDLRAFGGVERVPVYSEGGLGLALSPSDLEKAYASVVANTGKPPKVLLLTNPHNPLGRVLKRSELMAIADWCDSKPGLHLVSDEIYALSEFADELTAIAQGTTTTSNSYSGGGNEGFVSLGAISACADAAVRAGAAGAGAAGTAGAPGAKFGPFRHVLWGLSKDLGVSGFRVGVLWSQNETLLGAMQSAAVFTSVRKK
jgi:aspartate/methionine/tyrosine aminotransferase